MIVEGGLIIAGIAAFVIGVMVFLQQRHNPIALFFSSTAVSAAIWSFGILVFLLAKNADSMTGAAMMYYIAAVLIAFSALLIGYCLWRRRVPSDRLMTVIAFPPVVIALCIALFPQFLLTEVDIADENSAVLSPLFYGIYVVYFAVYYLIALTLLYCAQRRASAKWKMSYRYVFIAYLIGGLIGMWFNLILPAFGNYSLIWVGPLALFPFLAIAYVGVVHYKLFDIRFVVSRAVTYGLTLGALALIYILVATEVSKWLFPTVTGRAADIIDVASVVLLVLLFQPLWRFFDRITNSIFYRNRYHRDDFYASLNGILTSTIDLNTLFRRTSTLIADTFNTKHVVFVVPEDSHMLNVGTPHHARMTRADFVYMADWWKQSENRRPIVVRSLLGDDDESRVVTRLLQSYGAHIALLLRQSGEIRGLLLIGESQTGRYTTRDETVLETVSDELTIALQNAMSLREVRLLNETLQQRVNDATKELRTSNAQLRKLDESKDEFISMASHQLRTPLTSIKGYIDMILDGDAGEITAMQRRFLTETFVSSERMVHLINDFLSVSRLQTGKFMIDKRPVNLVKIVKQELESLRVNAEGRELSFDFTSSGKIPTLLLDEAKIRQVIMNFADNALYYSRPGTVIAVTLSIHKGDVVFIVKDTGIGVPKAEQAKLFTKFFRATNARKQRPDGTGVGLYLAKRVVIGHGGSIVFSSTEGRGSTFGFRLPLKRLSVRESADKLDN